MKRSGFPRLSYEEALSKAQARVEARTITRAEKPRQRASKWQKRASKWQSRRDKPKGEAAKAGKRRSKAKRQEKDALDVEFKREVRERDSSACQWPGCGYCDAHIDVQHIAKRSQRPDLLYDPENGVCLCRKHHNLADNTVQGRRAAKMYGLAGGETYELAAKKKHAKKKMTRAEDYKFMYSDRVKEQERVMPPKCPRCLNKMPARKDCQYCEGKGRI